MADEVEIDRHDSFLDGEVNMSWNIWMILDTLQLQTWILYITYSELEENTVEQVKTSHDLPVWSESL
jgi:hypothetical protein